MQEFYDNDKAYLELASWSSAFEICPFCDEWINAYRLEGKTHRKGLLKCPRCYKQFSILHATFLKGCKMSHSHICHAFHLLFKEKISILQMSEQLGITYKTAYKFYEKCQKALAEREWFLWDIILPLYIEISQDELITLHLIAKLKLDTKTKLKELVN